MNFVNRPRHPIARRELSLLKGAFHVNVLALLITYRDIRKVVVEHQAVPIRMRLGLAVMTAEAIRLAKPDVRHSGPRGQESKFRLSRQIARKFDPIRLHSL